MNWRDIDAYDGAQHPDRGDYRDVDDSADPSNEEMADRRSRHAAMDELMDLTHELGLYPDD